jgi:hypothetical protein
MPATTSPIANRSLLVDRLGFPDWETYRQWYEAGLAEILARRAFMRRQAFWTAFWTDSLAVGGAEWIEAAAAQSGMKRYSVIDANLQWPENVKTVFSRAKIAPTLTKNRCQTTYYLYSQVNQKVLYSGQYERRCSIIE